MGGPFDGKGSKWTDLWIMGADDLCVDPIYGVDNLCVNLNFGSRWFVCKSELWVVLSWQGSKPTDLWIMGEDDLYVNLKDEWSFHGKGSKPNDL